MKSKLLLPIVIATLSLVLFEGFCLLTLTVADPSYADNLQEQIDELEAQALQAENNVIEILEAMEALQALDSQSEDAFRELGQLRQDLYRNEDLMDDFQWEAHGLEMELADYLNSIPREQRARILLFTLGGLAAWLLPFGIILLIRKLIRSGVTHKIRRIWNMVLLGLFLLCLLFSLADNHEGTALIFAVLAGAEIVVLGVTAKNKDQES